MLRFVPANARRIPARGLATNILAQSLDRLSTAELKQEARRRGLSQSGNKATLITRIRHVETLPDRSTSIKDEPPTTHRTLATAATASRPTLDVKLPDLSEPLEVQSPHIPFMPDFWDSSRARSPDAIHHTPAAAPGMPKVLVVAGAVTHHAGGPSYSSSHPAESEHGHGTQESELVSVKQGFWRDVAEDLGLPQSASLPKTRDILSSLAQSTVETPPKHSSSQSRPLDQEEARGLWVFFGILSGSWLAGGLFSGSKKKKHSSDA